jgi:hypothetical protein
MEMRAYKRQHYFTRSANHFYDNDPNKEPFEESIFEETMIIEEMFNDLEIGEEEKTY